MDTALVVSFSTHLLLLLLEIDRDTALLATFVKSHMVISFVLYVIVSAAW